MNETDIVAKFVSPQPSSIVRAASPIHLHAFVPFFVERRDENAGGVVRLLPEVRSSIQFMLGDEYWQRERDENVWRRMARAGLWGPRSQWAYGYVERKLQVYAIALTPLAMERLNLPQAIETVNRVVDLSHFSASLLDAIAPHRDEKFDLWRERVINVFAEKLRGNARCDSALIDATAADLHTCDGHPIARLAQLCGLSTRHYRRAFTARFGMSPKRYQRHCRVDRLLRHLHANAWELDELAAYPIAFADQAHAAREFRELIGMTPTEYRRTQMRSNLPIRSIPVGDVAPPEAQLTAIAN